jgi:hypothetical protein
MAASLGFLALFGVIFANSLTISCIRPPGRNPECRMSKALLGTIPMSTRAVTDIVDVQEDETCDDGCTYRAVLITSNRESYPVNDVYTDEGPVQEQIASIQAFLHGTNPTYERAEPVSWWIVLVLGGIGVMVVGMLGANLVRDLSSN